MELDGGETVTVRAGDVVIQRGTNHLWHNRGTVRCRFDQTRAAAACSCARNVLGHLHRLLVVGACGPAGLKSRRNESAVLRGPLHEGLCLDRVGIGQALGQLLIEIFRGHRVSSRPTSHTATRAR